MTPRRVAAPLVAFVALLGSACDRAPDPGAPPPPRLLLVTWDTTRADHVGAYGGAARTPRFDALAAGGILYEQAATTAPITLTAHASLLTGVYPCAHGVRDNALFELAPAARLLSEPLQESGFKTGAFVAAYVLDPKFGLAQGFDVYDAPDASRSAAEWGVVERPAGAVVDAALRWVDTLRPDDRYFLWVHFYDPHNPYAPPASLLREGALPYDLEIENCDRELGRLLDRLRERGLDRGLVTAVTSDHGESLGEHGEKTHGVFVYESTMHVPLVIAPPPAGTPPGSRIRARVSHVDLAATLLERLGVGRAALPDARAPLLPSSEPAAADERALLLESLTSFHFRRWSPLRALLWRDFKYVEAPRAELFELTTDPGETHDLAAQRPEVAARMAARLAALAAEQPPLRWQDATAVTAADEQRFAQLGYVVAGDAASEAAAAADLPDPKDRIGELELRDDVLSKMREASALLGLDGAAPPPGTADELAARKARGQSLLLEAKAQLGQLAAAGNSEDAQDMMVLGLAPTIELALGNWAAAAHGFEQLVALHPRQASNHQNLANAYARLGRTAWAEREMQKVVHLDPQSLLAPRWLMEFAAGRRDFPAAAWWLDEILKRPALPAAERTQLLATRAQLQKQLDLVNAKPRAPTPVTEADLVAEGLRPSKCIAAARDAPIRRVLLVTLDTTRADRLGCYGHAAARTPFLDRMAAEGVRFERAWCAAPITLPSHATILSGLLPCAHGVRDNGIFVLDRGVTLLPELLQSRGFKTGAFVASFVLDERFGLAQGFDVYHGPAVSQLGLQPEVVQRPAASVVDDASAWLGTLPRDASFLLWVHFYDPHAPHEQPAAQAPRGDGYDAEIAACDAQLARLRKRLDELGFGGGLLEVVTADHGEALGEHGEATHGLLLHDATMRVPLLLRGDGIAAGRVVRQPVSNAQIAPTILAALGIEASALPESRAAPLPIGPEVVGAAGAADAAADAEPAELLLETFLPFHEHRWQPLRAIVVGDRKLVSGRFDELFDLATDPGELHDLAAEQPAVVAALARRRAAAIARQPQLPTPRPHALTAEESAQLRALGYAGADAGGGEAPPADESLPDPREAIGDAAVQQRALDLVQQARVLLGQDAALARGTGVTADPASQARGRQLLDAARVLLVGLAAKRPADPSLAFDLGNVELSAGRPADAVPHFELATLADGSSSLNHYNLGVAYAGSGDLDLVIAEMEKTIACEPRMVLAYRWLVRAHEQRGELGRAVWWADRVEPSGALDPKELPPMRAMREQLRARMVAAGQQPVASPTFPPKDLRPEGVIRREAGEKRGDGK